MCDSNTFSAESPEKRMTGTTTRQTEDRVLTKSSKPIGLPADKINLTYKSVYDNDTDRKASSGSLSQDPNNHSESIYNSEVSRSRSLEGLVGDGPTGPRNSMSASNSIPSRRSAPIPARDREPPQDFVNDHEPPFRSWGIGVASEGYKLHQSLRRASGEQHNLPSFKMSAISNNLSKCPVGGPLKNYPQSDDPRNEHCRSSTRQVISNAPVAQQLSFHSPLHFLSSQVNQGSHSLCVKGKVC